jgi:organic hydroperoxide reductase OsmC/OhrA
MRCGDTALAAPARSPKAMTEAKVHPHRYAARCHWSGSTGSGYEAYERLHELVIEPSGTELTLSADAAFGGDPSLLNPEQLLLAAAMSCQLLSFLAVAARARLDVVDYEDNGEAILPDDDRPVGIKIVRLRPRITVRGDTDEKRVERLVDVAHKECFIANTLRCEMEIYPEITLLPPVTSLAGPPEQPAPSSVSVSPPEGNGNGSLGPGHAGESSGGARRRASDGASPAPVASRSPSRGGAVQSNRRPEISLHRFVDDDEGYLNWVASNADGYVLNTARASRRDYLVLHRADCAKMSGEPPNGGNWTSAMVKICSMNPVDIDGWCRRVVGGLPSRCTDCLT